MTELQLGPQGPTETPEGPPSGALMVSPEARLAEVEKAREIREIAAGLRVCADRLKMLDRLAEGYSLLMISSRLTETLLEDWPLIPASSQT